MTYQDLYNQAAGMLKEAGCAEPHSDARELLFYASGFDLSSYALHMTEQVPEAMETSCMELLRRRMQREPVQYIAGQAPFYGRTFIVSSAVLIPRFDTENLVAEAMRHLRPDSAVLDLCTGSGCILLTILAEAHEMWGKASQVTGTGSDISKEALLIAQKNAERFGVKAKFILSDLFENISGTYDIITSNPPYIRTADILELDPEVRMHEPLKALDGMEDGLFFYRAIAGRTMSCLKEGGRLILEIGYDQADEVSEILDENGYGDIRCIKDLAGCDRVVTACRR